MRLANDFTPIAVGEVDWRAFDLTKDCDGETPANPRVVCTFLGPGTDAAPQDMVTASNRIEIQTSVTVIVGPQNNEVTKTGQFLVVMLGPAPSTAAGGAYQLQGLFDTPTRSNLSLSARLPCSAT